MTIRELIKNLSDADLDKRIDVAAWREAKKDNEGFSSTEKAFLGAAICEQNMSKGYMYIIDDIPIPDAGASIRELFKTLSDKELDRDIDDTIAKWREKKSYKGIVFLRLFLQQFGGRNYNGLAKVQIPDKNGKIDPTSKDNVNSKKDASLYVPTKEDFVKVFRELLKYQKLEISIDQVFDAMEVKLIKKGYELQEDWRTITEQNIKKWSK